MDEAFACPECGQLVKVRGLAPGRQVRCGFCRRLLEVPYLPRVAKSAWKRRRGGRPVWVPWAWGLIGVSAVLILLMGAWKLVIRREREAATLAVERLIEESRALESTGRHGAALMAIDSAIALAGQRPDAERSDVPALKERRREIARRDVSEILEKLREASNGALPLGDWLSLQARLASDPDLAPLRPKAGEAFHTALTDRIEDELDRADRAFRSGNPVLAFDTCESVAPLIVHMPPDGKSRCRGRAEALLESLIRLHGIIIGPLHGELLSGSLSKYQSETIPALRQGLRGRNYLPQVESPGWTLPWSLAPYRLDIELKETHEGNYLSSRNRLTRINARLRLLQQGREAWQSTPTARTTVPLPNLPAYYSSRIALSPDRIDDFEAMLYNDARGMIGDRLINAIKGMPICEEPARMSPSPPDSPSVGRPPGSVSTPALRSDSRSV